MSYITAKHLFMITEKETNGWHFSPEVNHSNNDNKKNLERKLCMQIGFEKTKKQKKTKSEGVGYVVLQSAKKSESTSWNKQQETYCIRRNLKHFKLTKKKRSLNLII